MGKPDRLLLHVCTWQILARSRDIAKSRREVSEEAIAAIRAALETADVEFTNGNEPGVKLRKAKGKWK